MLPHGNVCREVVLCRLHCLICHGLCTHTALAKASEDFGDMLAGNCQRHHIAWTACLRHRLHVQPVTTPRQLLRNDGQFALSDAARQLCHQHPCMYGTYFTPLTEVKPGEPGDRLDSDLAFTPTCRIEPWPLERSSDLWS